MDGILSLAPDGRRGLVAVEDPDAKWERLVEEDLHTGRALLREIVGDADRLPVANSSKPDPDDVPIIWAT